MEIKALWRRPRSATSASRAEQFAIYGMRLWWSAFPDLDRAWPDLVSGFCLHFPGISPIEEKLLEALAVAGRGGRHLRGASD